MRASVRRVAIILVGLLKAYCETCDRADHLAGQNDIEKLKESNIPKQKLLSFRDTRLLDHFLIVPKHRFLFCSIDKVASAQFYHALSEIIEIKESTLLSSCRGLAAGCLGYSPEFLLEKLQDSSWHKAVFVRDPFERLVSGYQSKCLQGHDSDRDHCFIDFGGDAEHVPSFERIVEVLANFRDDSNGPKLNQHWERQTKFCGGLGADTLPWVHYCHARAILRVSIIFSSRFLKYMIPTMSS